MSDEKDERRVLYEFWRVLPLVQIHDIPSDVMESHRVRPAIMKILRAGIADEKESGMLRHALNTKEIMRALSDSKGIKMSQHNLYFHLNKLEEIGYIRVVARIREGRHNVAYYGRTARTILRRDTEESLEKYKRWFQEMGRLAKANRGEFDMGQLEGLAEEYLEIMRRRDEVQGEWMASNERLIYEGEIDSYSIFGLIQTIDVMDPDYTGFIKKVRALFEITL